MPRRNPALFCGNYSVYKSQIVLEHVHAGHKEIDGDVVEEAKELKLCGQTWQSNVKNFNILRFRVCVNIKILSKDCNIFHSNTFDEKLNKLLYILESIGHLFFVQTPQIGSVRQMKTVS